MRQQPGEGLVRGTSLGRGAFPLILAPPADAVVLFGYVREIEKMAESARYGKRRIGRQRLKLAHEPPESRLVALARILGKCADALDRFEEARAFLFAQRLAEQFAEQPDIVAEWLVGIHL